MNNTIILYAYKDLHNNLIEFINNQFDNKYDLLIICNGCKLSKEIKKLLIKKNIDYKILVINKHNNEYPEKAYGSWKEGLLSLEREYDYYYFFKNGNNNKYILPNDKNWINLYNTILNDNDYIIPIFHLRKKNDRYKNKICEMIDNKNTFEFIPIITYIGCNYKNLYNLVTKFTIKYYHKPQFTIGKYMIENHKKVYISDLKIVIYKKLNYKKIKTQLKILNKKKKTYIINKNKL